MGVEDRYKKRKEEEKTKGLYNGVENRYLYKNIETVGKEINDRVNTWLTNNNNYISNAQYRFSGNNTSFRTDANDWLTTVTTQSENFKKEAENIKSVLKQYEDFFGEEYVKSVYDVLDGNLKIHDSVIESSTKDLEFWSQWESPDEYYTAQRYNSYYKKYEGKSYDEIVAALGKLNDGEEKEWLNTNRYGLVTSAADFADNSKYVSTYRGGEVFNAFSGMYTDTGYDDMMYDYINRDERAIQRQVLSDVATNSSFLGLDNSERGEMTEDEIKIFNYLYATKGKDVAYEYIDYLTSDLNYREREAQEAKWEEYAKKDPVGSSVFSVIESPLKGLSYMGQFADYLDDGKIDQNEGYNKFSYINSSIRNEVTETVEKKWGEAGSFAYQTGMSMADFLFTSAISGGSEAVSLAIMGASAAADTVVASKDMGLSDDQAFWLGTAAGAIEVATEKIGIDALFDIKALKGGAGKYILKNILAEGAEEGLSDVGNTLVELIDLALSGDDSKIKREIYAIMQEQNLDESAAVGKYIAGKFKELGLDMLGGAISGGIMGGGGAVIGAIGTTIQGSEMKKNFGSEVGPALVTEALEIDPANKYAQKLQGKVDNGKNLSFYQIGKLVQQNETAMYENDVASIQSATENRLTELGEKGDIKAIAAALTKQAQGERLTFTEREIIRSSKFGQRVANELNTDNIESGEYSSSWAERIGTDRINAEEYGRLIQSMEAENVGSIYAETANKTAGEAKMPNVVAPTEKVAKPESVAAQETTGEAESFNATKNTTAKENVVEAEKTASAEVVETEGETVTLDSVSKKYGAQAGAMASTYIAGQDVKRYDAAYQAAYDMGKSGVNLSYAMNSAATSYLTESQRKLAHAAGADASNTRAKAQDAENKAKVNGKTGRKKGVVRGEGVTINDLKKSFNDPQNRAYKLLTTYAEATGIDIVLYRSEANADGVFEGAQGKFKWSENTIYIDINAGLTNIKDVNELAKYTMMRTFGHEFSHFIEKWNPIWYNEFRKVVFDTLTERGENVEDLIDKKMAQSEGMSYDEASREVVAEAMTDILHDANFVEDLANNHKTIFEKLLEKLKEFVADLKAYFNSLGNNPAREANALKEQVGESVKYVENIVKLFDKVAQEAVENYQATVAIEEKATTAETKKAEKAAKTEKTLFDKYNEAKAKYPNSIVVYRVGDFFEVLGDDATFVAKWTGLTLTSRNDPNTGRVAMVGFPFHTFERYVEKIRPHEAVTLVQEEGGIVKEYPKASLKSEKITYDADGTPTIHLTEVAYEESAVSTGKAQGDVSGDSTGESRSRTHSSEKSEVQRLSAQNTENSEVQPTVSERNPERNSQQGELRGVQAEVEQSPEERQKAYKKKFSQWLKKASRKYVIHYGGVSMLSADGAFAMRATDDEIGWARLEFSGVLYESDLPKPSADMLDNATTLITEAPLEGKLGDDGVYIFNVDGKKQVFNKKLLSKLDGNLLYFGDFNKGFKVIKAVDADGNIAGFLLPLRVNSEITDTKPSKLKSFSNKINSQISKQEVKPNGENVDNRETVRQPVSDRQKDSHVLDEVQTEDVSGDVQRGDSVGDSGKRGQQTVRDDVRPDAAGAGRRSGVGDSQSGDIRRNDELTHEAEKLHEEVTEQIAQQSTEQPKGRNFVIGDSLDLPSGDKPKYKANIDAIRLVKQLETEGRYATEAEQAILAKYVGWGGLANVFDERKTEWSKEYQELKELLTDEEYRAARASTTDAFYTDIPVIKAMYSGLEALGFTGGRVLEPSAGVGNFIGAMPQPMSAKVKSVTMVELDNITGLISKYLYPNADVRIQGFEKATLPDNFMDVAIGNVPFGNVAIYDKAYPKKVTSAIHNYFFAKSLDKVRTGGIVMFITSSYTMSSHDNAVRRYIMQKADLLGAIRLPNTAFKSNAGTDVVADILILKKRAANTLYSGAEFLDATYNYETGEYVNKYFESHPEMILGVPTTSRGRYGETKVTYNPFTDRGSLADQIREAFSHIEGRMEYPAKLSPEKTNFAVERASKNTKQDGYVAKDGKIYQNKNGDLVEKNVTPKEAERIKGMLEIRDAARELMTYQQQGLNETEIKKARTKLNKLYDAYVKKNGYLNSPSNKSAFKGDPDYFSLYALENYNPETKTATKADIFTKNTIAPNRTVTSAKDVAEGLIVSVNQTGGVDTALIARLTGKTEASVTRELIDSRKAFKNRNGDLEAAEVYLSGNVRAKLRDAEALVPMDSDYKNNVEALKSVIPADVGYQDIFVNAGTPWIPNSVYSDFAAYMLGSYNSEWRQNVDVTRNPETGNFTVELKNAYLKHNAQNTQKWGTSRRTFLDLFDAMLNSKSVVIKDKLDDGSFVINKDATAAANEKIENIQKEFAEWLWQDEKRRTELATLYNETFNSVVTPKYNGDNLTVNGANANKPLRPHQRNAVQRVISSGGNTLLAHKVGAGKTYEMAAAAMKLKELGLVKKPMFAVPKSLVAQWGNEFMDFFPTAKLLVAEASDFTAANRKVFMNRIANGEYDAVIVSYEQFEKLPMSDDFTRQLYQEQIDSIVAALEEAKADKGGKALSVKDLEKKRKTLQTKIEKLTDKAKDEGNIDFEELGVDSLFIDEAHNFKNLFYTTSMTNVSGLGNKDGSKRAFDLYTKVRYLQQLNGGRGIVFATATPVMNSMSEMYIMQKYLQPDLLKQLGLNTFDAWAKQFGEVVNGVEIKPSGQGYRVKQSFSRFKNMSELQLLFRNFADVLTDIPGLKIPKMKGGKVNVVVCEGGEFQQAYMKELEKRADNIKNVDPSEDNMLKITSDGRKISYTQRMIDPSLPYEEGCKIYRCADNVIKAYNESKAIKGTQLIFCDMATPKGKSNTTTTETEDIEMDMESAKLYDDIRARLRQGGIPAKEIAFIHEADTDAKKKKLFSDVNEGKVRVLIGSTGKMGVGMNAQKRVVAIHHLDAPWRPGDVEQRNGRAFRQGNINAEVECFTYVTEGSFDARLWDILERKQNFINQVMNGESVGRETEDTGEVTLSAAEVKALASGSPLIMEQVQLDTDIKKLESLYRAHISAVRSAKERLAMDNGQIVMLERQIAAGKADLAARTNTYSDDNFSITIGKNTYTDKKEAGTALIAEAQARSNFDGYTTIGSFAGFDLRVIKSSEGVKGLLVGKQGYPFKVYSGNTTFMISQLVGVVESIEEKIKLWEHNITELEKDISEQEKLIAEPFAKQTELDEKRKRYNEVMDILNPKEEQSLDSVAEDTVQEQSRAYVQYQQRTNTLTDREILAMAAEAIKESDLTDAERDALQIFKNRVSNLETLQEERAEQGRLYKEQQFKTPVDRKAAEVTLNRMAVLDEKIKTAQAEVLSLEDKKVLGDVLKKARKVVEADQRAHDAELVKRWRERTMDAAKIKKYRERIQKEVNELSSWVTKPNNKDIVKHIPDALKNSVIPFLTSIDFTSKQQLRGGDATKADAEFVKRLNGLNAALKHNIDINGMYSGYNDLPPNFMEKLQSFINTVNAIIGKHSGQFVINEMTSEELRELASVVKVLKAYITQFNKFHANAMYSHVYDAGDNTIEALAEMKNDDGKSDGVSNFVFWQQMRPAFAFERFGNGGKAIYDGLRRGQAQLAFNTEKIVEFTEKTYTDKEVQAWEKEIKKIKLASGEVYMRVSDMMSLYELSKQPDSLRHMLGEGMRVATYTLKGKKISDNGHPITQTDIATIVGQLTQRQKDVSDALQKFMAEQGGAWGNYVSVARFGEEQFTNERYFPINSDGRHLQSTADEYPSAASLYALLNMSFTKSRNELANNRIIVYSIFDVFSNHMASMAQYNAMALPVLDALKWFNYQQKTEDAEGNKYVKASVREQMSRVYGVPEETRPGSGRQGYAESFVLNILKAFNGTEAQGVPADTTGMNTLRRYNMAQVAYNLRVVIQQPLAITRAALLIDYRSIIKGMKLSPDAIKQNIEEMRKHSGIAAWKSLGFYDVNISRGLADTIKHNSTVVQKIGEIGMWGAEQADTLAWAGIWSACKEEVIKKQKLNPKSEGFYDAVSKLFEDVIYKTQVVDSVLTKNEYMRSKGFFARAISSFMSEPVTTASMVIDAYDKYNADLKRGMNRQQAWEKNKGMIGRTMYVYAVSAVMLAAVQAVADAFRDDDDYEEWYEKWLEAFGGNLVDELMPINKLPIIADFYDLSKELLSIFGVDTYGNPPQSVFMQWYDSLVKGTEIIYNKIAGEDINYTWWGGIYKLLQAASGMSGLPMAAAAREVITAWNNTIGAFAPSLKVKSYDPGEKNEIKYAYQDGYLTFDEAAQELMEQGLVDNENEAYFTVSGWEVGDGYSRYDKVYDAVKSGGSITEAMAELTSHGYTEKEVKSQIAEQIGKWYYDKDSDYRISRQQAERMLEAYTDLTSEEITKKVNQWSAVVVTGIKYSDIGDEYLAGNITAERATEMYKRYGSMTKEQAAEKVTVLSFVKVHPNLDGISYAAVSAYTEYCETQGIDAEMFYDVWQFSSNATSDVDRKGNVISGSKKVKILEYIDSLDLSRKQKDSLYYALGWAKSTINDAPWR